MSDLLDSLLKRALPKRRDYTLVKYQGTWLPKWMADRLDAEWRGVIILDDIETPTNGEAA